MCEKGLRKAQAGLIQRAVFGHKRALVGALQFSLYRTFSAVYARHIRNIFHRILLKVLLMLFWVSSLFVLW